MWILWITVSATVLIVLCIWAVFLPAFRRALVGWRLLSASGLALSVMGFNFVIRFWKPTAGPYRVNELYPYGSYLHAWAVSFGFAWDRLRIPVRRLSPTGLAECESGRLGHAADQLADLLAPTRSDRAGVRVGRTKRPERA